MDDDFVAERTLCQLPSCHVFQIPRLANAAGHRAADWPKDPVWTGKVKITARGQQATIFLLDSATNANFATCHVEEGSVERVTDSGRYFVLKITNAQGKHAFIGIAFNERNDAFDFNVSLQEHKNECDRENQAAQEDFSQPVAITNNYKLAEGTKITVKLAGKSKGGRNRSGSGGGGSGLLAPPKEQHVASGGLLSPPPSSSSPASSSSASSNSVFGFDSSFGAALTGGGSGSSTPQQQQQTASSSNFSSDPFGSFSSDPFATSTSSTSTSSNSNSDPFGSFDSASPSSDPFSSSSSSSSAPPQVKPKVQQASSNPPNLLDF